MTFARVSILLLILCLLVSTSLSTKLEPCTGNYAFISQPPSELNCNPYMNRQGRINRLECNVIGPNYKFFTTEPQFSISWYRETDNLGQVEEITGRNFDDLANSVHVTEVFSPSVPFLMGIRSQVHLIRPTNYSEGLYWCEIEINKEIFISSTKLRLESPEFYESFPECDGNAVYADVSLECVDSMTSDVSAELGNSSTTTTTTVQQDPEVTVPTCSSASQDGEVASQDSILLPKKWIIVAGCIGGSLLVVIVVLTLFLLMVCARMRRGRNQMQPLTSKEPVTASVDEKQSGSIVNGIKEVKKPPPPVPEKPPSRSPSSNNLPRVESPILPSKQGSLSSTSQVPLLARGGVRRSLPARLPLTVNRDEGEEEYTPVLSHRDRKACTVIQKLKVACEKPKGSQNEKDSDGPMNEYRGLNPQMMDDIQPYDSTRGRNGNEGEDDDCPSDNEHPEYSEPDAHIWNQRGLVVSVDGEYVYPNNAESAGQRSQRYKQLTPSHQDYLAIYDTPNN